MNALQRARNSLAELTTALQHSRLARKAFHQRRELLPKPRAVQLFIAGGAPIQLHDADTGSVLGFRQTYVEAEGYAEE